MAARFGRRREGVGQPARVRPNMTLAHCAEVPFPAVQKRSGYGGTD